MRPLRLGAPLALRWEIHRFRQVPSSSVKGPSARPPGSGDLELLHLDIVIMTDGRRHLLEHLYHIRLRLLDHVEVLPQLTNLVKEGRHGAAPMVRLERGNGERGGEEITGEEITGEEITGEEITGEEISGEEISGEEITRRSQGRRSQGRRSQGRRSQGRSCMLVVGWSPRPQVPLMFHSLTAGLFA